jgi:hypothetical protein
MSIDRLVSQNRKNYLCVPQIKTLRIILYFNITNHSAKDGQLVNFVHRFRTSVSPENGKFLKTCKNTDYSKRHIQHVAVLCTLLQTTVNGTKLVIFSRTAHCQYCQSLALNYNNLPVLSVITLLRNHSRSSKYTVTF